MTQYVEINLLREAEYNPGKPLSVKDYNKLKKSFKEFGEAQPIVINSDYTVIAGHQRLKVMKDLGYTQVECKILDLTKEKEKALNIALNKIQGEWDLDKLTAVIGDLFEEDFTEFTGFDENEILDLVKDTENMHSTDTIEEIIQETREEIQFEEKPVTTAPVPRSIPIDTLRPAGSQSENSLDENRVAPSIGDKLRSFVNNKTEEKIDISFSFNSSQNEIFIKAIDKMKKKGDITYSSEAIIKICEEWLNYE